jgi:hypothetical protein
MFEEVVGRPMEALYRGMTESLGEHKEGQYRGKSGKCSRELSDGAYRGCVERVWKALWKVHIEIYMKRGHGRCTGVSI